MENRLFIDTNIFLDLLLNRGKFGRIASKFLSNCVEQKSELLTSISCIQTVIYVLQKSGSTTEVVKNSVGKLNALVVMANTSNEDISKALQLDFEDMEDAILYQTALSNQCMAIITQNVQDYPKSSKLIKVIKPDEF